MDGWMDGWMKTIFHGFRSEYDFSYGGDLGAGKLKLMRRYRLTSL